MIHINEWDAVPWQPESPAAGAAAKSRPRAPTALVDQISKRLGQEAQPPMALHFYLGEGLRWIRVGFEQDRLLAPSAVAATGQAIAGCLGDDGPLYFHALRSYDMLFFLEGGKSKSLGMGPQCYGLPLDKVLKAWALAKG